MTLLEAAQRLLDVMCTDLSPSDANQDLRAAVRREKAAREKGKGTR
jgi:hypothetical protein